jgi:hypothetical protein
MDTGLKLWAADCRYRVAEDRTLETGSRPRPFVGISSDVPEATIAFLEAQGYILDKRPDEAMHCGLYLDGKLVATKRTQVALIEYIESSPAPLVRFWRWPDAYKSALCVTGDLDALSLKDYWARLTPGWLRRLRSITHPLEFPATEKAVTDGHTMRQGK